MLPDASPHPPIPPGFLRNRTGRGRPYPDGVVATIRMLVETTMLRFDEIAVREGVHEATVGRWARRFGWRRPDSRGEIEASGSRPPLRGNIVDEAIRVVEHAPPAGFASLPMADRDAPRRRPPYGSADHEAARVLIEGTRLGLEAIGLRVGISTATLFRWQKRFRWDRPSGPDRPGPRYYRSRMRRGRPYAADALGIAQKLATQTLLSQKRIAVQAGVSQATVSNWIRQRGWTRPEAKPHAHRFAAARRGAPTAQSGDRRGRSYTPETVEEAGRLYRQTEHSTALIGARVKVSAVTVARWAKAKGWTRPYDLPDPHGRKRRRRRWR